MITITFDIGNDSYTVFGAESVEEGFEALLDGVKFADNPKFEGNPLNLTIDLADGVDEADIGESLTVDANGIIEEYKGLTLDDLTGEYPKGITTGDLGVDPFKMPRARLRSKEHVEKHFEEFIAKKADGLNEVNFKPIATPTSFTSEEIIIFDGILDGDSISKVQEILTEDGEEGNMTETLLNGADNTTTVSINFLLGDMQAIKIKQAIDYPFYWMYSRIKGPESKYRIVKEFENDELVVQFIDEKPF